MNHVRRYHTAPAERGFTLLELVIVVAILAILAAVALRSFDGLQQQSRFDATRQTMANAQSAVASIGRDADGSLLVGGFVADLGRLPRAVGDDPTVQCAELWSNPRNLAPFAVRPCPSDPDVLLPTGWRSAGYLRLPVMSSSLKDGWGRSFDVLDENGAAATDGTTVAVIRSRGADGQLDAAPSDNYDADLIVPLVGERVAPSGPQPQPWRATVSGRVFRFNAQSSQLVDPDPAEGAVTIRYFAPSPDTGLPVEQVVTVAAPFSTVAFSFDGTIGPRVIRAYQGVDGQPPVRHSVPVRLMLAPGGTAKDLVLQ